MFAANVADAWLAPAEVRHAEWIPQNIWIPNTKETPGPFNLSKVPHVAGVLDELDNPFTREIYLCWAARLGKTSACVASMISLAANTPRPAMFGADTRENAAGFFREDFYPYLEACDATRGQLLPIHLRNSRFIALQRSRIRRVYSRSSSSMAGFPACYALATEIDKWYLGKSTEARPVELFRMRGENYEFESKYFFESTPGTKGKSIIWELVHAPTTDRRAYQVPCPHCGEYQELVFGDETPNRPGVKFPRERGGGFDLLRVEAEAWYQCGVCFGKITNQHRPAMMRAGRWVSEGQRVQKNGVVVGNRKVESPNVAFGPLSQLYSLMTSGWGQVAKRFVMAGRDPEKHRNFQNSIMAQVYDPKPKCVSADQLAIRVCSAEIKRKVVPEWAVFLSAAVDEQLDGTLFPWWISAWGHGGRGCKVDHGLADTLADAHLATSKPYPVENTDVQMQSKLTLYDSGNAKDLVYGHCWETPNSMPCKGGSHDMDKFYDARPIEKVPGMQLMIINTHFSNRWWERIIHGHTKPGDPGFYHLTNDDRLDYELLEELLNEYLLINGTSRKWMKRHPGKPNDFRDCVRYSWAAAQYLTQHGLNWFKLPERFVYVADDSPPTPPNPRETNRRSRSGRRTMRRR